MRTWRSGSLSSAAAESRHRGLASRVRRASICSVGDTSAASNARYHELLRALSPERRLEAAMGLSRTVRALAEAGLRERHPNASDDEIRTRLTVRLYGRSAAEKLFGDVPDDAR